MNIVREFSIKQKGRFWYVIIRSPTSAYSVVPMPFEKKTSAEIAAKTLTALWEAEGGVAEWFEPTNRQIAALT